MRLQFQPMPLLKRAAPFDDPNWIYELKMDGFRALAIVEHGRAQLLSRNGHPFASFSALIEKAHPRHVRNLRHANSNDTRPKQDHARGFGHSRNVMERKCFYLVIEMHCQCATD